MFDKNSTIPSVLYVYVYITYDMHTRMYAYTIEKERNNIDSYL